jgi:TolB-like protein
VSGAGDGTIDARVTPSLGARGSGWTFVPGDLVAGRYVVARFIAEGGMGEVYEALDQELHEHVALKTVHPEVADDPSARARFKREIQLARRVTHAHVCRIFDLGLDGDVLFLSMEFLPGPTLAQRLDDGARLPLAEALPILEQIAAGLDAAHRAGVVHGDLKPSNVILVPDPQHGVRAVVSDFGLARCRSQAHDAAAAAGRGLAGTPAYMAPEQVRQKAVGPAADLYAFGVLMYRVATGALPFVAATGELTAELRLRQAPRPPRELVPDLDPRWEAAILACLEREPAARPAHAGDAVASLRADRPTRPRRAARALKVGLALAGLVAVGVGVGARVLGPGAAAARPARPVIAVLALRDLSGRAESAWLATAFREMLTTELAAGDRLRAITGEAVARVAIELGLGADEALSAATLERLRGAIGVDYLVSGSYAPLGARLRLDLRLTDARSGETVALIGDNGSEADLADVALRAGAKLRARLGGDELTSQQQTEVRASLPQNPVAARLYAEGLARARTFECSAARRLLEGAIAAEPDYPMAHAALADVLWFLGAEAEARAQAKRALDLSGHLSRSEQLVVEARYWVTAAEPRKAAAIYAGLLGEHPDNVEYGFALASAAWHAGDRATVRATIDSLRGQAPAAEDVRLEVMVTRLALAEGDWQRAAEHGAGLTAKGTAQGALPLVREGRAAEGSVHWARGELDEAVAAFRDAVDLAVRVEDKNAVAGGRYYLGRVELDGGRLAEAERTFDGIEAPPDDARGMGARRLDGLAWAALERGELDVAEERLGHAREAAALAAVDILARVDAALGRLRFERGDLAGARALLDQALAAARAADDIPDAAYFLSWRADVRAEAGDEAGARADLAEALGVWQRRACPLDALRVRLDQARLELGAGHPAQADGLARAALAEALRLKRDEDAARAAALLAWAGAMNGAGVAGPSNAAAAGVAGPSNAAAAGVAGPSSAAAAGVAGPSNATAAGVAGPSNAAAVPPGPGVGHASESFTVRHELALAQARARRDPAAATVAALTAARAGFTLRALDARLAAAELAADRPALDALAREARAAGCVRIAERAQAWRPTR